MPDWPFQATELPTTSAAVDSHAAAALAIELALAALSWLAGVQPVNRPGVYDKVPDDKNYSSLHLVCCNGVPGAVVGPD